MWTTASGPPPRCDLEGPLHNTQACSFLHCHGMVHADIKLENVLLKNEAIEASRGDPILF